MARPFAARDAKRLVQEHQKLKSRLAGAQALGEQCRREILAAVDGLASQESGKKGA